MRSSRRTFLKHAAGLSAMSLAGFGDASGAKANPLPSDQAGKADSQNAAWYDRPMRWAQLSFVEDDPGNYDLAFWLDYFKRIHADAALLRCRCTTAANGLETWTHLERSPQHAANLG
jgi:hypothetical protein